MKILAFILLLFMASTATSSMTSPYARSCIYLGHIAEQVMVLRQAGVQQDKIIYSFLKYPSKLKIQDLENIVSGMIDDAFKLEISKLSIEKIHAIWKFDNKWFEMCMLRKFKMRVD
jgi:hypothetical protein